MKTTFLSILVFFIFHVSVAQTSVRWFVEKPLTPKALLCSVYGQKLNVIAEQTFKNHSFTFNFRQNLPKGLYKIFINDTNWVSFIIDNDQEIELNSPTSHYKSPISVIKGSDNQRYYSFVNFKAQQIRQLETHLSKIEQRPMSKSNIQDAEKMGFLKGVFYYKIEQFTDSLVKIDSNAFTSKLIKAELIPNATLFDIQHPESNLHRNDIEFLMTHYFDRIDFSDSLMLYADLIEKHINTYIEKIVLPRNESGFKYANLLILEKAKVNSTMHKAVVVMLLKIYERTNLETIFVDLFETYQSEIQAQLTPDAWIAVNEKIRIIKARSVGSSAPDFTMFDSIGIKFRLSELIKPYTVLVFWNSKKGNTDQTMMQLADLQKRYSDKGFTVIAVSTDTEKSNWMSALAQNKVLFASYIIDTKSLLNPLNQYQTWALPSIYILDARLKIVAKPINIDYVIKECEKAFGK